VIESQVGRLLQVSFLPCRLAVVYNTRGLAGRDPGLCLPDEGGLQVCQRVGAGCMGQAVWVCFLDMGSGRGVAALIEHCESGATAHLHLAPGTDGERGSKRALLCISLVHALSLTYIHSKSEIQRVVS